MGETEYQWGISHISKQQHYITHSPNPVDVTMFLSDWKNLIICSTTLLKTIQKHCLFGTGELCHSKMKTLCGIHFIHVWSKDSSPWVIEHKIPLNVCSSLKKHKFTVPFSVTSLNEVLVSSVPDDILSALKYVMNHTTQ